MAAQTVKIGCLFVINESSTTKRAYTQRALEAGILRLFSIVFSLRVFPVLE